LIVKSFEKGGGAPKSKRGKQLQSALEMGKDDMGGL
jgi:hypothetical protein